MAQCLLRDPLCFILEMLWMGQRKTVHGLYLKDNFGGRNCKMEPQNKVGDLATILGSLGWPYWLGAFRYIDVVGQ